MMTRADYCRSKAAECEALAQQISDLEKKQLCRGLANGWREIAEEIERLSRRAQTVLSENKRKLSDFFNMSGTREP